MIDWLGPVRVTLDARTSQLPCFVRDDDGGWEHDRLGALLDVFAGHEMPIDVAVIPDALDAASAAELVARSAGAAVHLHQHGRAHVNHEPADQRKCEFGPSRALAALQADVVAGRARLGDLLGDALEPVFTPPWNRCSDSLGDVLAGAGIRVLSRDHTAGRLGHPLVAEVAVNVDWFGRTKGRRWSAAQLADRVAAVAAGDVPLGLMLHHGVTDTVELARIDALIALLASHPMVAPTSILALASLSSPSAA